MFSFPVPCGSNRRCSALPSVRFVSYRSGFRFNSIGVLLGGCGGLLLVLHGRLGFPFCCCFRRSSVCGRCHLCRLGCGIAGGLACSGLCWVSGLRLIFLLGLLGFLFRFGLLGKAAMLNVVLNDTGEYANIDSIMGLPVGMPVPEATTTPYWFDLDDGFDQAAFEKLPEWAQEKIKKSTQWQKEFAPKTEVKVDAGTGEVLSPALPDTAPDAAQGTGRAPF